MRIVEMNNPTLFISGCRDKTRTSEYAIFSKLRHEIIHMTHTVEQRQDGRIGPDRGRKRLNGALYILSFATEKDEVERIAQVFTRDGWRRGQMRVAERAPN